MNSNQKTLVELILFPALQAFHECDDKNEREKKIKNFTLDFCQKNNVDPREALDLVTALFKEKRKKNIFKFEHYRNGALKKVVLSSKKSKNDDEISIDD